MLFESNILEQMFEHLPQSMRNQNIYRRYNNKTAIHRSNVQVSTKNTVAADYNNHTRKSFYNYEQKLNNFFNAIFVN